MGHSGLAWSTSGMGHERRFGLHLDAVRSTPQQPTFRRTLGFVGMGHCTEPDLPQTARRFAILANAAAADKPRLWLAAKIAGAFSFARRRCLIGTGGRTSDAGIPRGENQPGRHGGHPRLGAR
jgi:hypothetical protein